MSQVKVDVGGYFEYSEPMPLTAVSLFAGVGGFDLAMERNGIKVVASVEIDKAARGVLQHRFPNTKHFEDVTTVTGQELLDAGFVPSRGIITGGFPCQDLSVAGKRAGLAGQRSGLYWEIVRLVDELRPKYFVLENVPGLLSSNAGRDFAIVVEEMAKRGYGVSWRVLDAQYFGVAQRRRRVFIVGCLGDGERTSQILALSEGLRGDSEKGRTTRKKSATGAGEGIDGSRPVLLTHREGNGVGGKGALLSEDISLTLRATNPQVLIDTKLARMQAFGQYAIDGTASALKARDYKDATDLVVREVEESPE